MSGDSMSTKHAVSRQKSDFLVLSREIFWLSIKMESVFLFDPKV